MRILAVQETDWLLRGPHPQHHFLERLAQRGHEVHVVHYPLTWRELSARKSSRGPLVVRGVHRVTDGPGVTLITPPFLHVPGLDLPSMAVVHAITIWGEVLKFAPDVIIGYSVLNSFVAMRIARHFGIPFVYQTIDTLPALVPWKGLKALSGIFVAANYKGAHRVLLISDALKDFAIGLGADRARCSVIPAGVDTDSYGPRSDDKRLRERFGLADNQVVLGYLGYVYRSSGLTELLPKIAEWKSSGVRISLFVVGDGEGTADLLARSSSMQLSDQVVVTGWQPYETLPALLDVCDIFVFPGVDSDLLRHVVPMKFYEYLAAGKPVVTTRLEGIEREFRDCEAVHIVRTPREITDTAMELLADAEKCRIESEIGRSFVEEHRGWFRLTEELESCLKALVTAGHRPRKRRKGDEAAVLRR